MKRKVFKLTIIFEDMTQVNQNIAARPDVDLTAVLPQKYDEIRHQKVRNHLEMIDNTQILGKRLEELTTTLNLTDTIARSVGKKFREIELFEAGNNSEGPLDMSLYCSNVSYFFMNHPEMLKYTGYDPAVHLEFTPIYEGHINSGKQRKKQTKHPDAIIRNYQKSQCSEFVEFQNRIQNSNFPIIFSHYVLGAPFLHEKSQFWKIPGLHIHTLITDDLEMRWMQKNHTTEYNVLSNDEQGKQRDQAYEFVREAFLMKNDGVNGKGLIKELCKDLFGIKVQKHYLTNSDYNNRAIITYKA